MNLVLCGEYLSRTHLNILNMREGGKEGERDEKGTEMWLNWMEGGRRRARWGLVKRKGKRKEQSEEGKKGREEAENRERWKMMDISYTEN